MEVPTDAGTVQPVQTEKDISLLRDKLKQEQRDYARMDPLELREAYAAGSYPARIREETILRDMFEEFTAQVVLYFGELEKKDTGRAIACIDHLMQARECARQALLFPYVKR
jgi:hypothetical protein